MDMEMHHGCCGDANCLCVPAEFVRLRYYFGQALGVVDLSDEQSYVVGKQRFHNLRAHGPGVLCGLSSERFVFPQGPQAGQSTTVLRVLRGAVLDACGREVLVGNDQCIDVAAWFAKHRGRPDLKDWKAGQTHPLWVALRYRECPSDPAPAPRDPCGCDEGGCEFARVREGFELALLTEQEHEDGCGDVRFPSAAELRTALQNLVEQQHAGSGFEHLHEALAKLIGGPCPFGDPDGWLCLAQFAVTLDDLNGTPRVKEISEPDNAIAERVSLLSTRALQALIGDMLVTAADEGIAGSGPRIGNLEFEDAGDGKGALKIHVQLVQDGTPPANTPLAEQTFDPSYVKVMAFSDQFQWQPTEPAISLLAEPVPHFRIELSELAAESRFRVTIAAPHQRPIVDQKMRPLRPARFARHFRLVADTTGKLNLAETLF